MTLCLIASVAHIQRIKYIHKITHLSPITGRLLFIKQNSFISGVMIYTIDNLPWIKERLNWQKESTHLALNQIISIYLTGSGMAIISRITPLYFYRHPLSR
ncbi:TPA: hypothetical protein MNS24_002940 [Klebsiella pneumoniae]|uniref:hypothetical protein n=6 Tax=Enterobacterales TaxID=91347 RepID=UPI000E1FD0D0|nr:hypothetical protein [Klebsiella pneumoniae]MCI8215873.1 hypothetical protein [Klebsiella pneumoniae]MDU4487369.1 hypothetical protein [Klebsiella pneumoniae]TYE09209.1 hypothetical protein DJ500_13990 [Klebsiella pneumoniae]TYE18379.1 hypothetical protein DJ510_15705 [Klebsiella pneumoniae]HBR3457106.1 hypothetical protein [Klebsiella pneumoniae]